MAREGRPAPGELPVVLQGRVGHRGAQLERRGGGMQPSPEGAAASALGATKGADAIVVSARQRPVSGSYSRL